MNDLHAKTLESDLLTVLRRATGDTELSYAQPPTPLAGGFWARLVRFRLADAPEGWSGDLVARVMPDVGIAAKEIAIQDEVAKQNYPTPRVHLSGAADDGLGRPFMVMDLARGAPPLIDLNGTRAITALPRLARTLPDMLADAMVRLHRLDPQPLRARLDAAGITATLTEAIRHLGATADLLGRSDLTAVTRWLLEHPTASAPDVICHGDLHPFNLLMDSDGDVTVLDWSAGLLAPAGYDVAFTSVILAEPPLSVPDAARPAVRAAGRWLSRRFVRAYEQRAGLSIESATLAWHQGVVCLRALVEVAGWVAAGTVDDHVGHPWLVSGPALASRLSAIVGEQVRAR